MSETETARTGLDPAELGDLSDWQGPLELRVRSTDGQIVSWETYRREKLRETGEVASGTSAATFLRLDRMRELERGRDSWAVGWREDRPGGRPTSNAIIRYAAWSGPSRALLSTRICSGRWPRCSRFATARSNISAGRSP